MRDFDVARNKRMEEDRSFRIGGLEFRHRPAVAPEAILGWAELAEGTDITERQWLEVIDETVLAILEPDCREGWATVRDPNAAHPVNITDLQELLEWLVGKVVGRPTGQPSGSQPGGATTGTTSTDGSSSPEAEVLVLSP